MKRLAFTNASNPNIKLGLWLSRQNEIKRIENAYNLDIPFRVGQRLDQWQLEQWAKQYGFEQSNPPSPHPDHETHDVPLTNYYSESMNNSERLAKKIIKEAWGSADSAASFAKPTAESESDVLLNLALGVAQRNEPKLVQGAKPSDKQYNTMIKAGEDLINGKIDPDKYVKKLEKTFNADLGNIGRNQVKMRVATSHNKPPRV